MKIVKDGFLPCKKLLTGTQKTVVYTPNNGLLLLWESISKYSGVSKCPENSDFEEKEKCYFTISAFMILTSSNGRLLLSVFTLWIFSTTSIPSTTSPNTVY